MKNFRSYKQWGSFIIIILLVWYLAYITNEFCIRIQGIQKFKRLKSYESEIDEFSSKLGDFDKDSKNVKKSLHILETVLSDLTLLNNQTSHLKLAKTNTIKRHPKDIGITSQKRL